MEESRSPNNDLQAIEELHEADLLVHVIDASNPSFMEQMDVVETLLRELGLANIPCLRVFNKDDRVENEARERIRSLGGISICALEESTLGVFLAEAQKMLNSVIVLNN